MPDRAYFAIHVPLCCEARDLVVEVVGEPEDLCESTLPDTKYQVECYLLSYYDHPWGGHEDIHQLLTTRIPFIAMTGGHSGWDYGVELTVSDGERNMSMYASGERWVPAVDVDILTGEPNQRQLSEARTFAEIYKQVINYCSGDTPMLPFK